MITSAELVLSKTYYKPVMGLFLFKVLKKTFIQQNHSYYVTWKCNKMNIHIMVVCEIKIHRNIVKWKCKDTISKQFNM